MRRTLIRITLLLLTVLLAVILFFTGQQHSLLLDNDPSLVKDRTDLPEQTLMVKIDNQEPMESTPLDRTEVKVTGRSHTITVEVMTEDGKVASSTTRKFTLGTKEMYLLSLPGLLAGSGSWLEEFIIEEDSAPEEEPEAETTDPAAVPGALPDAAPAPSVPEAAETPAAP